MQLQLPFDTALILAKTPLREDHPDVWKRYESKTVIRFGMRTGARVFTQLGLRDMQVIRQYICLWLEEQDLIPAELREPELAEIYPSARSSAAIIGQAVHRVLQEAPC